MRAHEHLPQPAVEKSVEIAASPEEVWGMLTETDQIAKWMVGAQVESAWAPDSKVTFRGTMPNFNRKYWDRGTVIFVERAKLLRYSHWSKMRRRPDLLRIAQPSHSRSRRQVRTPGSVRRVSGIKNSRQGLNFP